MRRRQHWSLRRSGRYAIAALFVLTVSGTAQATCYNPQQQLPAQTVSAFSSNPAQLLQQFPDGGGLLVARARDLAASDPATLNLLINLLPNATKDQKSAIGAGLAQAARICVRVDREYAIRIQEAIAQSKDQDAVLAFTSVAGDQPIGSVGAGGGAVGGQTNALFGTPSSTGPAQPIPGGSVPTNPFSISSSVTGVGTVTSPFL